MTTRFKKLFLVTWAVLFAACSNEVQQKSGTEPLPDEGDAAATPRREVFLALQNKLILANTPSTKGEVIATEAENAISTLDVYVFGSETEDGEYSFQERFAYRANPDDNLPQGATELELTPAGNDGKESTALLKLKKGLFVKLYCIANETTLIDPANGKEVEEAFFQPLTLTASGQTGIKIQQAGVPSESIFTSFHTRLLDATAKGDTLVTPLAMTGAYTTPLDLTNFENSARVQAAFRLTRLSSRIDIINNAEVSRFTIEGISLGHGRRGAQYFPIRVYGDTPQAQPDEIITYPLRTFGSENANRGLATGAFYCYPSSLEDAPFLILKGYYKVNETEMKPVSYQVPFTQQGPDGTATQLAVVHNHRYTVAITEADEYHLDASISVEDWADDGSIEYAPDNKPGELTVKIADAFVGDSEYDEKTRTVSMSLKDGSSFEIMATSNSTLHINKVYAGGPAAQLNDWLKISEPQLVTRSATSTYKYTIAVAKPYLKTLYPRATLRFTTAADASERLLFVEALSVPQPIETPQSPKAPNGTSPNPNSFDPELLTASVYRITGSQARIKLNCQDGLEVESKPAWLDVEQKSQSEGIVTFDITLTDRDVKESEGIIVFRNAKRPELKNSVTVTLKDASVVPDYTSLVTQGNKVTPGTPATDTTPAVPDDIIFVIEEDKSATVKVESLDGVTVKVDYPAGSSEWLSYSVASTSFTKAAAIPSLTSQDIVFTPVESKLAEAQKATVTLTNIIGGKEYVFTVTPVTVPTLTAVANTANPTQNTITSDATTSTLKLYRVKGSTITLKATALGGSKVTDAEGVTVEGGDSYDTENTYVVTLIEGAQSGSFNIMNKTDESKVQAVTVITADPTIPQPADITLDLVENNTATTAAIAAPEGCTLSDSDINWGSDGEAWFKLNTLDVPANETVTIQAQLSSVDPTKVKVATVKLKNKIEGGADQTFTVSPVWMAPENGDGQATSIDVTVVKQQKGLITIKPPYGGFTATSNSTSVATVSSNSNTGVITVTGVAPAQTTVKVANTQDANKSRSYTVNVTVGGAYTVQASEKILINGLYWTKGNLVVNGVNGCKVGAESDYGLHFRWGSLVGYDANNTATNPTAVVYPGEYASGAVAFTSSPSNGDPNSAMNLSAGTGDPCKVYLAGNWRMPTADEYRNGLGGGVSGTGTFKAWEWTTVGGKNGIKTGPAKNIFFPAAGYRLYSSGSLDNRGSIVRVWSSSPNGSSYAYSLYGSSEVAFVNDNYRSFGYAVRCVQEP